MVNAKKDSISRHYRLSVYAALVLLLAATLLASGTVSASTDREVKSFQGVARNEGGEVVYKEVHRMLYQDSRPRRNRTSYLNAEGQEFAILESSFTAHPYVPSYRFEDMRFGREEGTIVEDGLVRLYWRRSADAAIKQKTLPLTDDMITGQGLHVFLQDHLEELIARDAVEKVDFLVPLEGEQYSFRIRRLAEPGSNPETVSFRVEIDSWFLRLFAPYIEVRYHRETKRLLSYKGPSNLLDANREIQNVTITYEYEAPESVTSVTRQSERSGILSTPFVVGNHPSATQ